MQTKWNKLKVASLIMFIASNTQIHVYGTCVFTRVYTTQCQLKKPGEGASEFVNELMYNCAESFPESCYKEHIHGIGAREAGQH